jgi:hypothetical protein
MRGKGVMRKAEFFFFRIPESATLNPQEYTL